ncbi:hypothetical protein ACN08Z_05615 [Rothia sp. P7181]|uniref:hypothetical protein n=1 Tax=unclassified Rothia (in: high G+C Gram-positive bacteria) TaxID=2689056 RepID=UPI003AC472E2
MKQTKVNSRSFSDEDRQNVDVYPTALNSVITAIALGVITGFMGTMYHASIWYAPNASWFVPWGSCVAIVMVFCASLWSALRSGASWGGALVGIVAFILIGLFAFGKEGSLLVLLNPQVPVGIAGVIWTFGALGAALIAQRVARSLS